MTLPHVAARVRDEDANDRPGTSELRTCRRELYVVARTKASVRHLHHSSVSVSRRRAGLFFSSITKRLNRRDGSLDALLIVESRRISRQAFGLARFRIRVCEHGFDVQRRLLAALQERRLATERGSRRARADTRSVLRYPVEGHQPLVQQDAEYVGHQLCERSPVAHPERRQRRVTNLLVADDPPKRIVGLRPPRDLSCAPEPDGDRVQPERQQHRRTQDIPAPSSLHRLRLRGERGHVERLEHPPDQPRSVILRQRVFRHLEANDTLLPHRFRRANATRRFAHAPNISSIPRLSILWAEVLRVAPVQSSNRTRAWPMACSHALRSRTP